MVLGVGGRGTAGSRIIRNARTVIIFIVLKEPGRGAVDARNMRNAWDCLHFMVLEVGGRGGGWPQNHKKCKGLLSFSWFWKWAGGGRLASES